MRLAVWQARCVRDDLTRALAELSEIDGRDLAAFFEKGRNNVLRVRFGPFVPISVFFLGLAGHGNTDVPPCILYPTQFGRGGSAKSQRGSQSRRPFAMVVCTRKELVKFAALRRAQSMASPRARTGASMPRPRGDRSCQSSLAARQIRSRRRCGDNCRSRGEFPPAFRSKPSLCRPATRRSLATGLQSSSDSWDNPVRIRRTSSPMPRPRSI